MAKIYISSTYVDLKKEREAAAKAIRRLEDHQAVAMEDYVAADQRPLDKCLQDVKSCDAYIGIFAWRYGFIPGGYDKSITHLEYEAAKKAGIPRLIFLLDDDAPWPVHHVSTGEERDKIDGQGHGYIGGEGKLEETQVIDIMKKLALGLLETHKKNVIHRDIKPANVMLTPGGQVKILDFGISYQVTTSMTELVGDHHRTGTWPYMAPEQLSTRYGRENKQVDIWGFGVTMYQLLTGKFPFIDKDQIKDSNERPYEMAGASRKARSIVMKCLEKDRKNRFQNMDEVLEALNAVSMVKVKEKVKVKKVHLIKWFLMAASIIVLVVFSVFLLEKFTQKDKLPVIERKEAQTGVPVEKLGQNKKTIDVSKEVDYGDGIIMVYIPAGTFTMGSNDYDDEKPPHEVFLDGYWLGKTEVTVGQYKAFIKDTGHDHLSSSFSEYSPGDNYPVVCVSWEDADAYCKWLSKKI